MLRLDDFELDDRAAVVRPEVPALRPLAPPRAVPLPWEAEVLLAPLLAPAPPRPEVPLAPPLRPEPVPADLDAVPPDLEAAPDLDAVLRLPLEAPLEPARPELLLPVEAPPLVPPRPAVDPALPAPARPDEPPVPAVPPEVERLEEPRPVAAAVLRPLFDRLMPAPDEAPRPAAERPDEPSPALRPAVFLVDEPRPPPALSSDSSIDPPLRRGEAARAAAVPLLFGFFMPCLLFEASSPHR